MIFCFSFRLRLMIKGIVSTVSVTNEQNINFQHLYCHMSQELGKLSVREFANIEFNNIPSPKVFFSFSTIFDMYTIMS